jgi:Mn-containing catalase
MAIANSQRVDASEASGLRNLKCSGPLEWIFFVALIGAAQRVEHYEISGYAKARNLAQQLRQRAIAALLSKSPAEEENADQLLNQVARSLMSVAKMPAAVEQATIDGAE